MELPEDNMINTIYTSIGPRAYSSRSRSSRIASAFLFFRRLISKVASPIARKSQINFRSGASWYTRTNFSYKNLEDSSVLPLKFSTLQSPESERSRRFDVEPKQYSNILSALEM